MNIWNRLSSQARMAIAAIGGLAAVYVVMQGRRAPAPVEADPTGTLEPATQMPSDGLLGTGELGGYFSDIYDQLADITDALIRKETTDTTIKPAVPRPVGGKPPVTADGKQDPQLGKRRTIVQKVPKGTPETVADVSRRVYTTGNNWQHVVVFNANWIAKGAGPVTVLPVGHAVAY